MSLFPMNQELRDEEANRTLELQRVQTAKLFDGLISPFSSLPENANDELSAYLMADVLIEKAKAALVDLEDAGEKTKRIRSISATLKSIQEYRADLDLNPTTPQEWQALAYQIMSLALQAAGSLRQSAQAIH